MSDEDAGQVEILGQAGEGDPASPYTFTALPELGGDPDYSPRYNFTFPREWKEKHFRRDDEHLNDWGDDPFEPIEVDHTLESARSMVRGDFTLVVPFRRR